MNSNERSNMTKTSEKRGKTPTALGLIVCLGALPLLYGVTGCSTEKHYTRTSSPSPEVYASMVGPAGPEGPAGTEGAKGSVGATGAAGAGIAGPAGEQGPRGPAGVQGATGSTGSAGAIARGAPGAAGPVGPAGAQGASGATGEQGGSTVGSGGSAGLAGPAGPQGITGETGPQGPTLVGPTGPSGRSGPAGAQGTTTVGAAGATGPAGEAGPQGGVGATGPQGPAGVINRWTSYRDFKFESNMAELRASDKDKVSEIATYMKANPSLNIAIDGSMEPRNQDLTDQRVDTVRAALIKAGVPASRIQTGAFGDRTPAQNGRVLVLIRTAKN
jgi:hypothetical protein